MRPRTLMGNDLRTIIVTCQDTPCVPYRHQYQCWLCKHEGVLEFEPDVSQPSWTECHHCGLDNEIPPGLYDRPATIAGHVPSRMF